MLQINFDDFVALLNLAFVDFDGYYGDQCVDLIQFWNRVLGGVRFTGNAIDIFNQPGSTYTAVANTSTNTPPKGAIIIYGEPYGKYIDDLGITRYAGHIGLCTGNNTDIAQVEIFQQNDPTNSNSHIKIYNYTGCVGWLIPNQMPQNQQDIINGLRKERDDNWTLYQDEIIKLDKLQKQFDDYKTSHPDVPTQPEPPTNPNPNPPTNSTPTPPVPTEDFLTILVKWLISIFKRG